MTELLQVFGEAANDLQRKQIKPRHVMLTARRDKELDTFLQNVTFSYAGNVFNIHELLMRKSKKAKKKPISLWFAVLYILLGLRKFKRCPNGINNTPLNFQRMLNQLLDDLIDFKIYIDDLIGGVKGTSFIYQTTMKSKEVLDQIRDQKIENWEEKKQDNQTKAVRTSPTASTRLLNMMNRYCLLKIQFVKLSRRGIEWFDTRSQLDNVQHIGKYRSNLNDIKQPQCKLINGFNVTFKRTSKGISITANINTKTMVKGKK